ncbi:CHAD domain-containing protein [Candidatus Poribacteria bacterium]|nr:CHAD domain-containing protein [Candidatus Poribacteria bacterium]
MAKAHKISGVKPLGSYRENARIILPQKVEEVYTWEPFIRDAARREELHNMRISIKRLRYTMELFRVVYELPKACSKDRIVADAKRFAEYLAVIVDLQEILGDVHDSDVVLQVLTDCREQLTSNTVGRGFHPDTGKDGIAKLIHQTRETRKADYEKFLEKWEQLSAAGFKRKLLSFFLT